MRHKISTKDNFLNNSLIISLSAIISGGLGFLYQLGAAKFLSPEDYAILIGFLSVFTILSAPLAGLSQAVLSYFSINLASLDKLSISNLYAYTSKVSFVIVIIIVMVIYLIIEPYTKSTFSRFQLFVLLIFLILNNIIILNSTFLQALDKLKLYSIINPMHFILRISFGFFAVLLGMSINGLLMAIAISCCLTSVISFILLKKDILLKRILYSNTLNISIKKYLPTIFTSVGYIFLIQSDILVVNYYFDKDVAGNFAIASVIGKSILFLTTGFSVTIFPAISNLRLQGIDVKKLLFYGTFSIFLIGICMLGFLWLYGYDLLTMLYGEKFNQSQNLIYLCACSMFPMALILFIENFLLAHGVRKLSYIFIIFCPFQVLCFGFFHNVIEHIIIINIIIGLLLNIIGYYFIYYYIFKAK